MSEELIRPVNFDAPSTFNERANFTKVKFGEGAPLLEVELNEMQDIISTRNADLARALVGSTKFLNLDFALTGGTLKLSGNAVLDGTVTKITELSVGVTDGAKVYLAHRDVEITEASLIKAYGNLQSETNEPNKIKDPRVDIETTRRFQKVYTLTTETADETFKYLPIGTAKLIDGTLQFQVADGLISKSLSGIGEQVNLLVSSVLGSTGFTEFNHSFVGDNIRIDGVLVTGGDIHEIPMNEIPVTAGEFLHLGFKYELVPGEINPKFTYNLFKDTTDATYTYVTIGEVVEGETGKELIPDRELMVSVKGSKVILSDSEPTFSNEGDMWIQTGLTVEEGTPVTQTGSFVERLFVQEATTTNHEGRIDSLEVLVGEETAKVETTLPAGVTLIKAPVKSPVLVRRIDGETIINIVPLFDSGAWMQASSDSATSTISVLSPNSIKITNNDATKRARYSTPILVKPNTSYTVKVTLTGEARIIVATDDGATLIVETTDSEFTFNSGQYSLLRIYMALNFVNGSATFTDLSVSEGTVAKPFVANVKGLTNPTIVNETNGTSLVIPTTLHKGEFVEQNAEGELVKTKKEHEVILDNSVPITFDLNRPGFKTVRVDVKGYVPNTIKAVKYTGSLLSTPGADWARGDEISQGDPNNLYISISNTDSGWGDNYTPTPEEIKAYFLGWKMYHGESHASLGTAVPYNGTGTKYWALRWTPNCGYTRAGGDLVSGTGTQTLPTVSAKDSGYPNTSWKPYRLVYERATPVQEVISPYGDLTLEKGDNDLKVYAGRIVNEYTNLSFDGGSWNINNPAAKNGAPILKHKALDITSVYENGKEITEQWDRTPRVDMNGMFLQGILYDPTSSYKVDYEPFNTWEVTAPISNVQLQYFETIQAVVSEITKDLKKLGASGKRSAQLIADLVRHTNAVNPHAETANRTISVGANKEFKTIQSAIDSLKKNLGGKDITIALDLGTYTESVLIHGFKGGRIFITGATTAGTIIGGGVRVEMCDYVSMQTLSFVQTVGNTSRVVDAIQTIFFNIEDAVIIPPGVKTSIGVYCNNSGVRLVNLNVQNSITAVHSDYNSNVSVRDLKGSNNERALRATYGAVIAKGTGNTITATTLESVSEGGVIR